MRGRYSWIDSREGKDPNFARKTSPTPVPRKKQRRRIPARRSNFFRGRPPGSPSPSPDVISEPATDGFVRQDGAVVTASAILCGVDVAAPPPFPEDRGFLSFPLGGIPPGAVLEAAPLALPPRPRGPLP